jgi:thiamine monophosphate kinase
MLEMEKLPISNAAKKTDDPFYAVFNDGEDFELLFTAAPEEFAKLQDLDDVQITSIGTVTDTLKMQALWPDGRIVDIAPGGYDHL